jgi:hypothetical protein
MLVEYPTSLEREMQTKKSHEIPDIQWGQTPDLQQWIEASKAERERQQSAMRIDAKPEKKKSPTSSAIFPVTGIFQSFKPNNKDFGDQFRKAKHSVLKDIGVNDNMIVVSLSTGDLVIDFSDPEISIEPYEGGLIVNYHEFGVHTLTDLISYVSNNDTGLQSCIFWFVCNNRTFEYLIQPTMATRSLDFQLTFQEHGADDA